MKTVSIVMCTYNGEKYLKEQVDSILSQTYPLKEILIQDDGSTDGTREIIRYYEKHYPDLIKGFFNEKNLGWNQNFYSVILKAKADLIVLSDQDDIWLPNRVKCQVDSIEENMIDVVSSWYWQNNTGILTPRYSEMGTLAKNCFFPLYCGHQMCLRSDVKKYISIGMEADMAHDRFLSILGSYLNAMHVSRELMIKWRRHDSNTSGQLKTNNGISGKRKIMQCMKSLLKGRKSPVITRACDKYILVLERLNEQTGCAHKDGRRLQRLMGLLRDQRFFGYIRASIMVAFMSRQITNNKRNILSLNVLYGDLTYVWRWWFDHYYDL